MKNVKLLMVLSICAIGFSPVFAQKEMKQVRSHETRSEQRTEKISEELELTPEQQAKLAVINEKYAKERQALAKNNRAEREENRKAMKQLNEAQKEELNNLLTPDQRIKMEEYRKESIEKRAEHRKEFKEKRLEKSDQ